MRMMPLHLHVNQKLDYDYEVASAILFSTKSSLTQLKPYLSKNLLVDIKKLAFHWIRNLHIKIVKLSNLTFFLLGTYI